MLCNYEDGSIILNIWVIVILLDQRQIFGTYNAMLDTCYHRVPDKSWAAATGVLTPRFLRSSLSIRSFST